MQVALAELPDERETPVGLHETVRPVEGVTDSAKLTLPEKPPKLARLMVDEALELDVKPTVGGLAETV
jgi:hypothetical protein